jgi:[acyl-carrier-protein] S-malonyltransferase
MLKLALVFPGQGSQYIGMGKELAESYEEAARVFEAADKISGYKISNTCFEGPQESLDQTVYAQPAIMVCSLACLAVARKFGLSADLMAGLSLGEYTALTAAGAMSMEEAVPLVMARAKLMQEAVPIGKGAMAAVIGLKTEIVESVCQQVKGTVIVANYNCPGQLVISGDRGSVEEASELLKQEGAKTKLLAISVPCHSPLLEECAQKFANELARVKFRQPVPEVVSNVNARENALGDLPKILAEQLYSPVRWEQSVRYMMDKVDYFIEIGPGSSLSGLIKKIDRNRVLGQVEDNKSLQKLLEKVKNV